MLIEAGDLKKGSAMRAAVEASKSAMALPCYADEGRSLDQLIDTQVAAAGLRITQEARTLLRSSLGGDRLASRMEVEKLVLYCAGRTEIDAADVTASSGDVSAVSADEVIDMVLLGDRDRMDARLQRALASGTAPFLLLLSALRMFQSLSLMRAQMDSTGRDAAGVVAGARPPIFFARRRIVETALAGMAAVTLDQALDRLQRAVLLTRRRPELAVEIVRQTLLALATIRAARDRRR